MRKEALELMQDAGHPRRVGPRSGLPAIADQQKAGGAPPQLMRDTPTPVPVWPGYYGVTTSVC
jgi:hypothetical protein